MKKEELIMNIAADMLNGLNIHQIVQIARDFSLLKAEEYYDNLSEEQMTDLKARFTAADLAAKEQQPKASEESPVS